MVAAALLWGLIAFADTSETRLEPPKEISVGLDFRKLQKACELIWAIGEKVDVHSEDFKLSRKIAGEILAEIRASKSCPAIPSDTQLFIGTLAENPGDCGFTYVFDRRVDGKLKIMMVFDLTTEVANQRVLAYTLTYSKAKH